MEFRTWVSYRAPRPGDLEARYTQTEFGTLPPMQENPGSRVCLRPDSNIATLPAGSSVAIASAKLDALCFSSRIGSHEENHECYNNGTHNSILAEVAHQSVVETEHTEIGIGERCG